MFGRSRAILGSFIGDHIVLLSGAMDVSEALGLALQITSLLLHQLVVVIFLHRCIIMLILSNIVACL